MKFFKFYNDVDSLKVIDKLVPYYNDEWDGSVGQRVGTGNGPSVMSKVRAPAFLYIILQYQITEIVVFGTKIRRYFLDEDKKITYLLR